MAADARRPQSASWDGIFPFSGSFTYQFPADSLASTRVAINVLIDCRRRTDLGPSDAVEFSIDLTQCPGTENEKYHTNTLYGGLWLVLPDTRVKRFARLILLQPPDPTAGHPEGHYDGKVEVELPARRGGIAVPARYGWRRAEGLVKMATIRFAVPAATWQRFYEQEVLGGTCEPDPAYELFMAGGSTQGAKQASRKKAKDRPQSEKDEVFKLRAENRELRAQVRTLKAEIDTHKTG